jgi:hypothetical protein
MKEGGEPLLIGQCEKCQRIYYDTPLKER